MFDPSDLKKGINSLKKTQTVEKTRLDLFKEQGDLIINITSKNTRITQNQIDLSVVEPELSKVPSKPPPAPSGLPSKPVKKNKKWKVELPGTKMDPKFIQIDPSLDKYPTHHNSKIKIMVVQCGFIPADKFPNFFDDLMNKKLHHQEKKPDIVIFPENFIGRVDHAGDFNFKTNPLLKSISEIIKKHRVHVILGTILELTKQKEAFCTSLFINRFGELIGSYRKRKHPNDTGKMSIGEKPGIFKTEFGIMAILICYDVENPELLNETLLYKPQVIFNPTFIPNYTKVDYPSWKIKLKSLSGVFEKVAFDNKITIVRCDLRNLGFNQGCSGTSQVLAPVHTERVSSFSDSTFFTYVDKEASDLVNFNEVTREPEKIRSLNQDNTGSRISIDNFEFSSELKKISFFKDKIIGLDIEGNLKIFIEKNHDLVLSKPKVDYFYCNEEFIWIRIGKEILKLNDSNEEKFGNFDKNAWIVFDEKLIFSDEKGNIFINESMINISESPIIQFKIYQSLLICCSKFNETYCFDLKKQELKLKLKGNFLSFNDENQTIYYIDEENELFSSNLQENTSTKLLIFPKTISSLISLNQTKFVTSTKNIIQFVEIKDMKFKILHEIYTHSLDICQIKFDGKNHLLSASKDGSMKLLEIESNRMTINLRKFFFYGMSVNKKKFCPVQGSTITKIMNRPDHSNEKIPIVLKQTCQNLCSKEENLKFKGIFRESSSVLKLDEIYAEYDSKTFDPNETEAILNKSKPIFVSSVLRQMILKLPVPFFGYENYGVFLELAKTEDKIGSDKKVWIFRSMVEHMNKHERNTLNILLYLLLQIDSVNEKMKIENLAKVMTPCMTAKKVPTMDDYKDSALLTKSTQYLIKHHAEIFNLEEDVNLIKEIYTTHFDKERIETLAPKDFVLTNEMVNDLKLEDIEEVNVDEEDLNSPKEKRPNVHYISTKDIHQSKTRNSNNSDVKKSKSYESIEEQTIFETENMAPIKRTRSDAESSRKLDGRKKRQTLFSSFINLTKKK